MLSGMSPVALDEEVAEEREPEEELADEDCEPLELLEGPPQEASKAAREARNRGLSDFMGAPSSRLRGIESMN